MQIKFLLLTALVGFLLSFTACKKEGRPSANSTSPDIYLAGISKGKNAYWKNGKETELVYNGTTNYVNSIVVSATNDVYVTGDVFAGSPIEYAAVYWKNGQLNFLTDPSKNIGSKAYGIFIDANDVYIAGSVIATTENAAYWKNGVLKIVGDLNTNAQSIFVSDGNPYLAGSTQYFNDIGSNIGTNSTYWNKNTSYNITDLVNGTHSNGGLKGLFVSGNDVYTTGITYTNSSKHVSATYWKNANAYFLSDPDHDAIATAISVSDNNIFVCGSYYDSSGLPEAVYWENGVQHILSQLISNATAIYVYKGDVYIAGYVYYTANTPTATYWKNGVLVKVGPPNSSASSIFVK